MKADANRLNTGNINSITERIQINLYTAKEDVGILAAPF